MYDKLQQQFEKFQIKFKQSYIYVYIYVRSNLDCDIIKSKVQRKKRIYESWRDLSTKNYSKRIKL